MSTDLSDRFGPQGVEVDALIRRTSQLTAEEADQLSLDAARDAGWDAAWNAAWNAARDAGRGEAWWAAWDAAWWAAGRAAWDAAWYAPAGALGARRAAATTAAALSMRHLISDHGFTRHHYDTLTGPWREVIGPVHPDDIEEAR